MKKFLVATSALVALAAFSGSASATDQDITLSAEVTAFCTIGGINDPAKPAAITKSILTLAGGKADPTVINVPVADVLCNRNAEIQLLSAKGALTATVGGAAASGFDNFINYGASVTYATKTASVTANGGATGTGIAGAKVATDGATNGSASIDITPVSSNVVVAGTYSDTLTFRVTPTP